MRKRLERVALILVKSLYASSNSVIGFFRALLFLHREMPKDAKRILIYRVGNVGDIICAVASMRAIRKNFPQAKITLLSSPGSPKAIGAMELLRGAEFLDDIIIYYKKDIKSLKGKLKLINDLKRRKFDIFIELPMDLTAISIELRNLFFAKIIGTRNAFGFNIGTIRIFARIQSKYINFINETKRLLEILHGEHLDTEKIESEIIRTAEDKNRIDGFLTNFKGKRPVILNPNAKRQANLWSIDKFAEVGRWIVRNYDLPVLIIGGEDDSEKAERLRRAIGEGAVNIAGSFTILQTLELISRSQLLISNDTGAVHMAASVGTPVVGIYSAWQIRGKWFPLGSNNIILREEPACHSCYRLKCEDHACLKNIGAEKVCAAAEELLRRI